MKPFYEMRPDEILKARNSSGCALIPVGPVEWHSYHLPIGTDALIAEGICRLTAKEIKGIYFKPLLLGTDKYRTEEQLLSWGFKKDEKIFGMNFPELPLVSEYCKAEELVDTVSRRLQFVKDNEFRVAFVVDHHGGDPAFPEEEQKELLKRVCNRFNSKTFKVEFADAFRFCSLEGDHIKPDHSGISESTFLLAFRPDLIDLNTVPEGKLIVKEKGIINGRAIIESNESPRLISKALADEFRKNIIGNFVDYIKKKYLYF